MQTNVSTNAARTEEQSSREEGNIEMQREKVTKSTLTYREISETILWTFRLALKVAKVQYALFALHKLLQVLVPILLAYAAAQVLGRIVITLTEHTQTLSTPLIFFVILALGLEGLNLLNASFGEYINLRFRYVFDEYTFSRYIDQLAAIDMQYHESATFKTMLSKVNQALKWETFSLLGRIVGTVTIVLSLLFIAGVLLSINITLLLLVAVPVIINFFIEKKFGTDIYSIWGSKGDDMKKALCALRSLEEKDVVQEAKIYGFGTYISQSYKQAFASFTQSVIGRLNLKYGLLLVVTILRVVVFAGIQLWLIQQTINRNISITNYSFYLQSLYLVTLSLTQLQENIARTFEHTLYVYDLKKFLSLSDVIVKPEQGIQVKKEAPSIEFRHVSFKYPGSTRYILRDLSFIVQAGERIALVGENGVGKSTLIKLLARFYDATEGDILINGSNIKDVDLESYYALWGVLFQSFAQYWFTARENIGIGNIHEIQNLERIKQASTKVGADVFIETLPLTYENMLSPDFTDGVDLSGGQWQKIGIARGMFANPNLIVLDEPTSALDALAEAKVFEEIERIAQDTTMFIVSHRFATVRNADRILVLEQGHITEQGNHDELMVTQAIYHKMFTTQAEGYK